MPAKTPAPAPLKYSVRQAAAALNVSTTYAYRMITLGRLVAVLDGERRFITSAELRRYVESLPTVPVAPRPKPRSVGRPRRAVEAIA
jgi:excisionase family DNA binding protein